MALNAGTALAYLDLDTSKFSNGIKQATSQLSVFSKDTATSGQKMEALGKVSKEVGAGFTKYLTVPLLGMGALSVKTAADFEAGMSKVSALSGTTGADLKMLEDKAKEMGATTKFSATEASEAMSYMALAGWDAEQMAAGLGPSLYLAGAAGMDLARTTDIVTDTMSMFGMQASEAGKMTDILAYAQANSNTSVDQLGEALKYCGASANAMGYDLADTAALLGTFADQGLKGSSAGTTLNSMFRDMKAKASDGAIAIGEASVSIVDAQGNYRDMTDILADVQEATEGMTVAQRDQALSSIWGTEALKGINMAFQAGVPKIREFEEGIRDSDGTAQQMYQTMQDNLKGAIDNFKSALEGAAIVIGERLIPMFQGLVEWATNCLTWFNNLDEGTQTFIVAILALVAAIGPLLMLGGTLLTMLPNMAAGFAMAKTGVLALNAAFMASPVAIGLIVAALVGLMASIGDNANALDFLQDKFGVFGTVLGATCEFISGVVQLTFGNMIIIVSTAAEAIAAILTGKFSKVDDIVKEGWSKVENNTAKAMSNLMAETSSALEFIKSSTEQDLQNVVSTFDLAMSQLPNLTRDNASEMAKVFTDNMQQLDDQSLTILRGTSDSMAVLFEGIVEGMDNEAATKKFTANLESMATSGKFSTETLQSDIDKAMKLINENMLVGGEAFKQTASNVFNEFKTIGQQGTAGMASNVVAELQKMDAETFGQLTAMGGTWSSVFQGITLDGSMSSAQMKEAIIANVQTLGIDASQLISQLRTESTQHMKGMSQEADSATKELATKVDANTKSAKEKGSKNTKDLATDVDKNTKDAKTKADTNTKELANSVNTNTTKAKDNAKKNTSELAKNTDSDTKQAQSKAKSNMDKAASDVSSSTSKMASEAKKNTSKVASDTDTDFKKATSSIQRESTNMYNGAKQSFTKLAEVAKQAGSDAYNGVRVSFERIPGIVQSAVSTAATNAGSKTSQFKSAGKAAAQAWIDGFNSKKGAMQVAVSSVPSPASLSLAKATESAIAYARQSENYNTRLRNTIVATNATRSDSLVTLKVDSSKNKDSKSNNTKDSAAKVNIYNTYNSPKAASIRELKKQDEIQMRRLALQLNL